MGHFVSSPREREKIDRRVSRRKSEIEKDEEMVNNSAETEEILACLLIRPMKVQQALITNLNPSPDE